jgi:hypothetical protein
MVYMIAQNVRRLEISLMPLGRMYFEVAAPHTARVDVPLQSQQSLTRFQLEK